MNASSTPSGEPVDFFNACRTLRGSFDELRGTGTELRPVWRHLGEYLASLGIDELARREGAAYRQLQENGATYNVHGDQQGGDHPWELDIIPFVVHESEWNPLAEGLAQRAKLLNLMLADLYGPQTLLRDGLIPPEIVFDNAAFLRPCHGIAVPGNRHLHFTGFDVCRMPNGEWTVVDDLTQAPVGAGYVLENRIVLSRLLADHFRDSHVQRLAMFFQSYRETLFRLAPRHRDNPRIVMLSNGPMDESYFEHSFLARYLGHTLVEGEDMAVREQSAWLKMLGGLQPVDVIVRRVEDQACDSLELSGGAGGLPGLLQAVRAGQVVVANALGSGLLESAAFLPFLPAVCSHLLGEPLRIPSIQTWWCGDPESRAHVLSHLDECRVFSAFGTARSPAGNQDAIPVHEIEANPHRYVAQPRIKPSTAPVLKKSGLASSHIFIRTFAAATDDGYAVMPGGLARAIEKVDVSGVALSSGGVSKDLWVVSDHAVAEFSLLSPVGAAVELSRGGGDLPSRVADNLFWLGRYVERADYMIRIARVLLIKLSERPEGAEMPYIEGYLAAMGIADMPLAVERDYATVEKAVTSFLLDESVPAGLRQTVDSIRRVAGIARDRISADTWRMLNRLDIALEDMSLSRRVIVGEVLDMLDRLITRLAAFSGVSMEGMTRGHGWRFLDMGRRLERALETMWLLQHTLVAVTPNEAQVLEDVLGIADSSITYRRRYLTTLQTAPTLDLLLTDETNPRSLIFQMDALVEHVNHLPRDQDQVGLAEDQRVAVNIQTRLRLSDINQLASSITGERRVLLDEMLQSLQDELPGLSDALTRQYLSHARPSRQLETARNSAHALPRTAPNNVSIQ